MALNIRNSEPEKLADELDKISLHCSRLPVLDPRAPDEILGYDEHGEVSFGASPSGTKDEPAW